MSGRQITNFMFPHTREGTESYARENREKNRKKKADHKIRMYKYCKGNHDDEDTEDCEDFINETGNIRDLVYGKILGQSVNFGRKTPDGRPKILLIDEVDVFFNKDFYGNM